VRITSVFRLLLGADNTVIEKICFDEQAGILVAHARPARRAGGRCGRCGVRTTRTRSSAWPCSPSAAYAHPYPAASQTIRKRHSNQPTDASGGPENGYPLDYILNTQPKALSKYRIYGDPRDIPVCGTPAYWCPGNSGGGDFGPQNMWQAFGSSVNTYFVPLFDIVSGDKVMDTARRLGLTFYNVPDNPSDKPGEGTKDDDYASSTNPAIAKIWSPFTLGQSTHPPLQIANAFATLAADGLYCEPTPVESIHNIHNQKLNVGGPKCSQNIDPEVARAAIDAARCPVGDGAQAGSCGGATAGESKRIIGKPIAGKTGTSDNESTATLTITSKQLAMSGFLVDPDYPDTPTKMKHKGNRGVNPAVQNAMAAAMKNKPGIQFTKPTNSKLIRGTQVSIPSDVICKSVPEAQGILKRAG